MDLWTIKRIYFLSHHWERSHPSVRQEALVTVVSDSKTLDCTIDLLRYFEALVPGESSSRLGRVYVLC